MATETDSEKVNRLSKELAATISQFMDREGLGNRDVITPEMWSVVMSGTIVALTAQMSFWCRRLPDAARGTMLAMVLDAIRKSAAEEFSAIPVRNIMIDALMAAQK